MNWADQKSVCERFGTEFYPCDPGLKVGISRNVLTGLEPLNGMRIPPDGSVCGWYIWAGGEPSQAPDFYVPLHVIHLHEWAPLAVKYLGLPPGWRFLVTETYEDVWYDENLLNWGE